MNPITEADLSRAFKALTAYCAACGVAIVSTVIAICLMGI